MEVIDKISSTMIKMFDFVTSSHLVVFILVVIILYGSYIYLGNWISGSSGETYSLENTPNSNNSMLDTFSVINLFVFIFGFTVSFILFWMFIHLMSYVFKTDLVGVITNVSSSNDFNNFIRNIDYQISRLEDFFLNLFREKEREEDHDIKLQLQNLKEKILPDTKEEVYNVSNNLYSYDDAKSVCKAFNARLATYKEIEDTYISGGEWCNYGWGESQLALFPTQSETYDKLQKIKGHENDCGRPGVNGGFIANPNVKFGANCYGIKPKKKEIDAALIDSTTIYPTNEKDLKIEQEANYWKDNIDKILINPFSHNSWNRV